MTIEIYGFIIDRDHLFRNKITEESDEGMVRIGAVTQHDEPTDNFDMEKAKEELVSKLTASPRQGIKFKLYDDDGELYYSGRYIGPDDSETAQFSPLDWGTWNAGCTYMKVKNDKGEWVVL